MTLVPRASNWLCTRALALWPTETIVVTAAMPITTPSTVSPARILFLPSARRAIRTVMGEIISSWSAPSGSLRGPGANSRHHVVARLQAPLEHLGVFAVGQSGVDLDGPQQIVVDHPDVAPLPLLAEPRAFVDGDRLQRGLAVAVGFGARFGAAFEDGHVLGAHLLGDRIEPQGRIRDFDDVLALIDLERQAGGHSGKQIEVRIGSGDDDRISDDVLFRGRAQTDLKNRSAE